MYSMLMMTSLAAGPDVTEFHGFFRNLFSFGGGCSGSCSGSSSSTGRSVRAGAGCTGSRSRSSCTGNYPPRLSGSCTGRASASCQGADYYSSCSGSGMSSSSDLPGMMPYYASTAPAPCSSCPPVISGGTGGTSPPIYTEPPTTAPFARPQPADPGAIRPPADIEENRARRVAYAAAAADRATVVVKLPADARLYAQGQALQLTTDRRAFVTPPLPPGEFGYTFRAEYVRSGETVTQSRQVAVRPGETFAVEFVDLMAAKGMPAVPAVPAPPTIPPAALTPSVLAADRPRKPMPIAAVTPTPDSAPSVPTPTLQGERARITLKLPAGATLYVDGRKHDRVDAVRQFDTPPVPAGQTFTYAVRVEIMKNGRPESQSEQVTVRPGETTTRDFTNWLTMNAEAGGDRVSR